MTEASGLGETGVPTRPFAFDGDRVRAVVTTRRGGVSAGPYDSLNLGDHVGDDHDAVLENRRRLCAALDLDRLTIADQQHTSNVTVVDARLAGRGHDGMADSEAVLGSTDGMVTNRPETALAVMVADCAPVVLFDPAHRAIGVAHCGRNGVVLNVLGNTVETMRARYGTNPEDLLVGVGPAIGAASYEIGQREADLVTAAFPDPGLLAPSREPGHWMFDLVGGVRRRLRQAGVVDEHVDVQDIDTRQSPEDFFSDRAVRPCGRFMGVVVLPG